jgi:parallel beta-helix repeat protein
MKTQHLFTTCLALIGLALLTGCNKDASLSDPTDFDKVVQERAQTTHLVHEGESIQAAVDAAEPGDIISILPGTYAEAVEVNKPNLTMIGHSNEEVVIINPGGKDNGICVMENGNGFELSNVTIKDFEENGIILYGIERFRLSNVIAINDGEYGIYPVHSENGEVIDCEAKGHFDTGIYVGQSKNVTISQCRASENVVGFEVENCTNVSVSKSEALDNTVGFLVILLPFLPVKESQNVEIHHNKIHNNNLPNFAPPGELAAVIPSGSGFLIVGSDNTIAFENDVTHNDFIGIGVASTLVVGQLAGIPPEAILADIEPYPDRVEVRNNTVMNNGTQPPPIPFPAVDLLWDGSGTNNCWSNNKFETSFPDPLPSCE